MTSPSLVSSPLTLVAMFFAAEPILGPARQWLATSTKPANHWRQNEAVRLYLELRELVSGVPELATIASFNHEEVNRFLREKGLDIQLGPFNDMTFGTAAVTDIGMKWTEEAKRGEILVGSTRVPSFVTKPTFLLSSDARHDRSSTFWIKTQTDDLVGVAMAPRPSDPEELLAATLERMQLTKRCTSPCEVELPMVDLNLQPDVSYLVGMSTQEASGNEARISQALMQAIFRMNHLGARSLTGMAMAVTRSFTAPPPRITFDQPFLAWIERPGLPVPLAAYYIEQADWREPAML